MRVTDTKCSCHSAEIGKKMRFISHISNLADVQSVRTPTLRIHLQVYIAIHFSGKFFHICLVHEQG